MPQMTYNPFSVGFEVLLQYWLYISLTLAEWAEKHAVKLKFIGPGKPTQNAFIERFNLTYRTEALNFYLFRTLTEVRKITERWLL